MVVSLTACPTDEQMTLQTGRLPENERPCVLRRASQTTTPNPSCTYFFFFPFLTFDVIQNCNPITNAAAKIGYT